MGAASINGITIGYDDTGAGENVLVLVHGHPFDRSMWRPQVEEISSKGWRVIAPDLRGYGESSVIPGKTTLDVFATDIATLLNQLNIQEIVIGGLSMGGQIVMEFCRLYPERVRGVLLAATFPRAETEEGKRNRAKMADRLLREGMETYAEEVLPKMVARRNIAALPAVAEHVRSNDAGGTPGRRCSGITRPSRASRLRKRTGESRRSSARRGRRRRRVYDSD
jgi:3-oxoadipate enol-lactonase